MAAVRKLEFEFCDSGIWTTHEVNCAVRLPCQMICCRSDLRRRRYCDFMILPVWLENAQPRPLLGVFEGFQPLKIVGRHRNL